MTLRKTKNSDGDTGLTPVRYVMSANHVSACFNALGMPAPASSFYADLPAAASSLPQNIIDSDGAMNEQAGMIFSILSAPQQVLMFQEYFQGGIGGVETKIISGADTDYWVVVSKTPHGVWDFALLTNEAQLIAAMDMVTGLSDQTSRNEAFMTRLSLAAIATLAAICDDIRVAVLRQELAGGAADRIWLQRFDAKTLAQTAEKMQEGLSPTSKFVLMSLLGAGAVQTISTPKQFKQGLNDLSAAGFLDDDKTLSISGHALVSVMLNTQSSFAVNSLSKANAGLIVETLFFAQADDLLLGGVWERNPKGQINALTLTSLQPGQALTLLQDAVARRDDGLATPASSPKPKAASRSAAKFCSSCGEKNERKLNFCPKCGAKL